MKRKINYSYSAVYVLLMAISFVFSRFSCLHTPPNHDLIKLTNTTNKNLLFYINTKPNDTSVHLLNVFDSLWVNSVDFHNDTFYMTYVSPFEKTFFRGPKYCNKPFWDKNIESGVLILYVIDKTRLLSSRDIDQSLLKKIEIRYDYLFYNSCTIVYKEE